MNRRLSREQTVFFFLNKNVDNKIVEKNLSAPEENHSRYLVIKDDF